MQDTLPLSGLEITLTHWKANKFIEPKLLEFFTSILANPFLTQASVQVFYLKMSSSFTLLAPTSLSPNQNSYLPATPNTFRLQDLQPCRSPIAGSKASSDTYLPLDEQSQQGLRQCKPMTEQSQQGATLCYPAHGNCAQILCALQPD